MLINFHKKDSKFPSRVAKANSTAINILNDIKYKPEMSTKQSIEHDLFTWFVKDLLVTGDINMGKYILLNASYTWAHGDIVPASFAGNSENLY